MLSCGSSRENRSQRAVTAIATYHSVNQMTPLAQSRMEAAAFTSKRVNEAPAANSGKKNPTSASSPPLCVTTHGHPAMEEKNVEVVEHQV